MDKIHQFKDSKSIISNLYTIQVHMVNNNPQISMLTTKSLFFNHLLSIVILAI